MSPFGYEASSPDENTPLSRDDFQFRQVAKLMLFVQGPDCYTHEERLLINEACARMDVPPAFEIKTPTEIVEDFIACLPPRS